MGAATLSDMFAVLDWSGVAGVICEWRTNKWYYKQSTGKRSEMDGYSGGFEGGGAVDQMLALAVVSGRLLVIARARLMPRQTKTISSL